MFGGHLFPDLLAYGMNVWRVPFFPTANVGRGMVGKGLCFMIEDVKEFFLVALSLVYFWHVD